MIEALLNLPQFVITALLLASLVLVFVVASKVMEMIFESVILAVLSGAFYVGLTYFIGGVEFAFNDLLLYSVLGPAVYMLYSFLSTMISTTSTVVKIPLGIITSVYKGTKKVVKTFYSKLKELIRSHREERGEEKSSRGSKSTKEVVLNNDS